MRKHTAIVAIFAPLAVLSVALAQDQGIQAVIGNVFLQNTTPGTAQVGHATITGTFRAGQVNVSQGTLTTVPVIGNNTATGTGSAVGGSFSAAQQSSVAVRGTATSTTGPNIGVFGETRSSQGTGVLGLAKGSDAFGVWARNTNASGPGLVAENTNSGGLAARFLGRTEIVGPATVQGLFGVRNSGGNTIVTIREFAASETQLDLVFPGGTAFSRLDVDSQESGLSLGSKNLVQVRLQADLDGVGRVTADVKNFVQPDPDNEDRDIVYACVEGPEAAAYVRGTSRLVNGQATVALPRHFQNVATQEGMTVQLTPLSRTSKGLCVELKTLSSFRVGELLGGQGNYEFDWEVKAVRRGFTNYKVYRPWDENNPNAGDRQVSLAERRANARKVYGIVYQDRHP